MLCTQSFTNIPDLQIHLFSKLHRDREAQTHASFQVELYRRQKQSFFPSTTRARFPDYYLDDEE